MKIIFSKLIIKNKQLLRYLISGLINTGFSYLAYCIGIAFLPYITAYTIGFIVSVITGYFLNTCFVFRVGVSVRNILPYCFVLVTQLVVGRELLQFWVEYMQINKFLAPLLNIILISPLAYIINKNITKKYAKNN